MADQAGDRIPALAREQDRIRRRVEEMGGELGEVRGQVGDLVSDVGRVRQALDARRQNAAPPPSWLGEEDPAAAGALLRDLIPWLDAVYLRYPGASLATCWAWHPWVVEELAWLAAAHRAAYDPDSGTIAAAAEWHERWRPGVVKRLSDALGFCDLSSHVSGGSQAVPALTAPLQHAHDPIAFAWTTDRSTPEPTDHDLHEAEAYERRHHVPNH